MTINKQSGFAALEVILLIVVAVAIGVIVLKVSTNKPSSVANKTTPVAQTQDDKVLTSSQSEIDNEDLDTQLPDEASLDAELATF